MASLGLGVTVDFDAAHEGRADLFSQRLNVSDSNGREHRNRRAVVGNPDGLCRALRIDVVDASDRAAVGTMLKSP